MGFYLVIVLSYILFIFSDVLIYFEVLSIHLSFYYTKCTLNYTLLLEYIY